MVSCTVATAATGFRPFTLTHGLVVAAFAAITALAIWNARRLRRRDERTGDRAAARFTHSLGVFAIGACALNLIYWFLPGIFDIEKSLPLHVCDLTLLMVPLALLFGWRWSYALVWFVGVGLSSQGFVTPVIRSGPETMEFWNFWIGHGVVVGGGLYLVIGLGFRPRWRDFGFACGFMTCYLLAMLAINIPTGWNYGYVGRDAAEDTIITALGAWPWRLVPLSGLAVVAMLLLMAPFAFGKRRRDEETE